MDLLASGGLEVNSTLSGPVRLDALQNWMFQVNSDSYQIFLLCQLRSLRRQENKKKRAKDGFEGEKEEKKVE